MKSNKKSALIVTILFLHIFFISCEELVEVDTPNNQIITAQVFSDVQTANAAVAGLYAGLYGNSPVSGDQSSRLLGSYTDDLECFTISNIGQYEIFLNEHTESNLAVSTYWSAAYKQVYIANAIIEGAEKSTALPPAEKDRIKGEALLVRSILYFYLQQIFGDIPYTVTTDYKINKSITKTSSPEVLTRLENDLAEAATLLTDDYRNNERIFLNRKVAELMLAKVYMTGQQWSNSETLLKGIIESPLYVFESNIAKVFNKSGTHILWQLKPQNPGDATKEALAFYFVNAAPNTYALSEDLVNTFSSGDLRRQNWITAVTANGNTWYRPTKYVNRTNNATEYSIVFRLEEAYLLLAESLARQNKVLQALPYINATRQRANLEPLSETISQNQLLNEILLENRKEFFAEMGHRFLTLKRMGALNTLISVKPNWKDYHRLWPLPQSELLLNPRLNPQNNGY